MGLRLNTTYQEAKSGRRGQVTSDMTVRGTPSPLITAVAEAGDCFCKPRFLHLFNGEVALPGAAV